MYIHVIHVLSSSYCSFESSDAALFNVTISTNDIANIANDISALVSNDINNQTGFVTIQDFSFRLDFGTTPNHKVPIFAQEENW